MLRLAFALLMLGHGLIHLMGFIKAFDLAELPQLTLNISKPRGIVWLTTAILFCTGVVVFLSRKDWWWMFFAPAILLSQLLIILYWQDAKFGTIANVIALAGTILGYGQWSFAQDAASYISDLTFNAIVQPPVVREQALTPLLKVVQTWLKTSGIVGQHFIQRVHLQQLGQMRTSPEGNWLPVQAQQWFTVEQPGFVWVAEVGKGKLMQFNGRDLYYDRKGHMLIKAYGLIPVVDKRGAAMDQGVLLRFLAETIWFPTAALAPYISWTPAGERQARASITDGNLSASGIFSFDEDGKVTGFSARRYFDRKEGATLEDWLIEVDPESYQVLDGIAVPTRARVTWKLEEGAYTWFEVVVKGVRYNQSAME